MPLFDIICDYITLVPKSLLSKIVQIVVMCIE